MYEAYAKPSDCLDIVPSLTERDIYSERLEASLVQSLLDASRLFESDIFAPTNFFAAAGPNFETKKFYGNGTEFVRLLPYAAVAEIHNADGELIAEEEYRHYVSDVYSPTGYFLRWRTYNSCVWGWNHYSPITVKARWGFPCIPGDVNVAVKNMGCLMFLSNPNNRLGQVEGLEDGQADRLRNIYNRVVSNWQDRFHHFNLGVV